jgi:hypothetical protein
LKAAKLLLASLAVAALIPWGIALASSPDDTYDFVTMLVRQPEALQGEWSTMARLFPAGCKPIVDSTQLDCPPISGVARIAAVVTGSGMVDIVFEPPITCERLYETIVRQRGPGEVSPTRCGARWSLRWNGQRAELRLARSRVDPSRTFLQMAMEQGP